MNKPLTIVMYHYVRNLKNSKYPKLKGLDLKLFSNQLDYLLKHYCIVQMEDVIDSIHNEYKLPLNAALLTFDDGYRDHFDNVLPVLQNKGIQGSFYPPVSVILEQCMLDVNKIHFILASIDDKSKLVNKIYSYLDAYRDDYALYDNDYYYNKISSEYKFRYDTEEVIFIKCLLQVTLPEQLRNIICNKLFMEFVSSDEKAFSREQYMNLDMVKKLVSAGMHVGSHGYKHCWFNKLSREKQVDEIDKSLSFLKSIKADMDMLTFSYPYGSYNNDTLEILDQKNFKLAVTTEPGIAQCDLANKFIAGRLDTNDLPKDRNATTNIWFDRVTCDHN